MFITFTCEKCNQQLEIESTAAGSEIECPACNTTVKVPPPDTSNVHVTSAISSSAAAKEEHHFSVPVSERHTESLIEKPNKPLEVAAKDDEKRMRIRTIKRGDCVEVGKDKFDEVVSEFLNKVGQEYLISIDHINYTNRDMATGELMSDFGVLIVYRG